VQGAAERARCGPPSSQIDAMWAERAAPRCRGPVGSAASGETESVSRRWAQYELRDSEGHGLSSGRANDSGYRSRRQGNRENV